MNLLTNRAWKRKYDSDTESLVKEFYEPALERAVRYDRATGFFSAKVMTPAMRGLEGLIRNQGRMRLIIGCTLGEAEVIDPIEVWDLLSLLGRKLFNVITPAPKNQSKNNKEREALFTLVFFAKTLS